MNSRIYLGLFPMILWLVSETGTAQEASGTTTQFETAGKTVVLGTYQDYNLLRKLQVSAAMISNPSRLKTVDFGVAYDAGKIKNPNASAKKILMSLDSGSAVFAKETDAGYIADENFEEKKPWLKGTNDCSKTNLSSDYSSECVARLTSWLTGDESKNYVIITSDTNLLPQSPKSDVINWHATSSAGGPK